MDGHVPLEPVVPGRAEQWGDWRLGDLSDALRRVATALGPGAPADRVTVYPPSGHEDLPWVQLTVDDEAAVQRLRELLSEGEYLRHFLADLFGTEFQAEINDVYLDVRMRTAGQ